MSVLVSVFLSIALPKYRELKYLGIVLTFNLGVAYHRRCFHPGRMPGKSVSSDGSRLQPGLEKALHWYDHCEHTGHVTYIRLNENSPLKHGSLIKSFSDKPPSA